MMKIIFLNIWYATRKDELTAFIEHEAPTTDVFCFQEATLDTLHHLQNILPGFVEYTASKGVGDRDDHDIATYIRSTNNVTRTEVLLQNEQGTGLALLATIRHDDELLTVVNIHGISTVIDDKLDTPGRLVQSNTIITALKDSDHPAIVGGDFNLLPEAESVTMFAATGYRDLIADHKIKTTRNKLAWGRFPDNPQYYADYVFTNSGVQVRSFSVPDIEVSDHLPLIVEFDTSR